MKTSVATGDAHAPAIDANAGSDPDAPFHLLAESIAQLAWIADADGQITWYNQRWYDYTGTTLEQMRGWGWQSVHDPAALPDVLSRWRAALATGTPWEDTFRLRRADGVFRWHLSRAMPVRDARGRILRWFGTNTDVDAQRAAVERAQFLAEASEVLAEGHDVERTVADVARLTVPRMADWCAVDLLEPTGFRRLAVAHVDPAKVHLAHELWQRMPPRIDDPMGMPAVVRTGVPEVLEEIPDRLLVESIPDPTMLALMRSLGLRSSMCVPLKTRTRTLGALTLVSAESGRRFDAADLAFALELARRAAIAIENAQLADARALAEAMLRAEREALTASNRELDQFAYVASHDLKAPLRGIANLSQWIEEDLAPVMTDEAREHMRMLRGRVHRLEALIDGILAYSRAGRTREKTEHIDVGRLLSEVVELLAPPATARVTIAPEMPTLRAERVPLQQVFLNLMGNALKHAGRPDASVTVEARDAGTAWEFAVRDNGPGIAAEFHERIWQIFQTLEARDKVEGTGVGLSVVRKIVETRGGRTWVESSEGRGATFFFTWPKSAPGS